VKKIEELVGTEIKVKTIEVDREKNRLIFSEREVSEAGLLKAQEEALGQIKVGEIFTGNVTGVMPFGLFVKVGKAGVEGLVHISEISWEKVEDPSRFFKVGDEVQVKVLIVDKTTGKLNLSIKQLKDDPWLNFKNAISGNSTQG
jgi:ribosomal protein S1